MAGVLGGPVTLSREAGVPREQLNTSEHFGEVTTTPRDVASSADELLPHGLEWRVRALGSAAGTREISPCTLTQGRVKIMCSQGNEIDPP